MSTIPPDASQNTVRTASRFAIPARMHVILLFMVQFMILITAFGIAFPALRERGIPIAILVVASAGFVIAIHLLIGMVGKLLPVRCKQCRAPSQFLGFGWWPFIYRYVCRQCGLGMRFEVGAR